MCSFVLPTPTAPRPLITGGCFNGEEGPWIPMSPVDSSPSGSRISRGWQDQMHAPRAQDLLSLQQRWFELCRCTLFWRAICSWKEENSGRSCKQPCMTHLFLGENKSGTLSVVKTPFTVSEISRIGRDTGMLVGITWATMVHWGSSSSQHPVKFAA